MHDCQTMSKILHTTGHVQWIMEIREREREGGREGERERERERDNIEEIPMSVTQSFSIIFVISRPSSPYPMNCQWIDMSQYYTVMM